jgi:uncharacterized SAM-dependent methyltransferase
MAKSYRNNSQLASDISRLAKPSPDFYTIFSQEEVLGIIHALESRREIPLKYSYKGRGAKIWDDFYRKYIIPTWYRTSNVEIELLRDNYAYITDQFKTPKKINIIDVGAGNSYPVKEFISRFNKLGKVHQYMALDISEELLNLSRKNFQKWFPLIEFHSHTIDIENSCISPNCFPNQSPTASDNIAKIIFHLGVTIGNHYDRVAALKNFRESMDKNDLLVFTNEIGCNSQWDGKARGGCSYHVSQIYKWIKSTMGILPQDCELVRKYDFKTDSIVANIKFCHDYTINFSFSGIDKNIQISKCEEITIWRHHKYEIPELQQELEQAGLQLVHYSTNKYLSHVMGICQIARN